MSLRRVDLNLLTIFDAVMQEGNLTRAADKIGMSQSAISDAVQRLRFLLKDELFVRTGHGVRPTPRAQQYAGPIRRILDQIAVTLSEIHSFDYVTSTRSFNLVLGEYGEVVVLSRLMQWLDGMSSTVNINIKPVRPEQITEALRTGAIDLYLSSEPIPDEDYACQQVTVERLVSMVRRGHPLVKNSLSLEQFLSLRHAFLEWSDPKGSVVDQILRAQGKARQYHLKVHSFYAMPSVVASTDMLCSMPSQMATYLAPPYKLKVFPHPIHDLEIPIYLIWHKRFDPDPGHTWIREALMELLAL